MYLLITNDTVSRFPYTLEELRADNPHTSFPLQMGEEELAAWGVFEVETQSPPAFNEQTESLEPAAPALVDGRWVRKWITSLAPAEEVERRTTEQARIIRSERNRLLASTDFSQLPDFAGGSQSQAALAEYRQALRGLPQQSGFPWAVVWPEPTVPQP